MQPLTEETQYLFDQRLGGDLSAAELAGFDNRLASDPAFAQQWREYQLLASGLMQQFAKRANAEDAELRQRIATAAASLEAEGFFSGKKEQASGATIRSIHFVQRYIALAAVLVLVLAAIWFFNTGPDGRQLFATHFKVEQTQLSGTLDELEKFGLGDADAGQRQLLAVALSKVEQQEFVAAIPLLRKWLSGPVPPSLPNADATARFYLAQSLMAIGNTGEEPVQMLEMLGKDATFPAAADARWFLALCHLRNKRFDEARPLLQNVSASGSAHAAEAAGLLEKIH